jgi:peptidoglycan/xylan/chitin deacetylase (PgdA/CDA1 family)
VVRLKQALRRAVDSAAQVSGILRVFERRMTSGLTVLMYHRVLPDDRRRDYLLPSLAMPESAFRAQMALLASRAEVLPLGQALAQGLRRGHARPLVAVTFDDGYADNFEIVAPAMDECGLRCTFFVTTDFVGQGKPLWFDRALALLVATPVQDRVRAWREGALPEAGPSGAEPETWIEALKGVSADLREAFIERLGAGRAPPWDVELLRPMRTDDLRALRRAGHEILSHGTSHSILPGLSDASLLRELEESRAVLGEWLGELPTGLAYPNGDHDARVREAARSAGYTWACTTRAGLYRWGSDPMQVPRRAVTPGAILDRNQRLDSRAFRCEISGLREPWRRTSAV